MNECFIIILLQGICESTWSLFLNLFLYSFHNSGFCFFHRGQIKILFFSFLTLWSCRRSYEGLAGAGTQISLCGTSAPSPSVSVNWEHGNQNSSQLQLLLKFYLNQREENIQSCCLNAFVIVLWIKVLKTVVCWNDNMHCKDIFNVSQFFFSWHLAK